MRLEHLMDLRGRLYAPWLDAGAGPYGTRYIYNAADGSFEGPRLKGRLHPGGGDWPVADAKGTMRLDIRLALQTDDGATIYLANHGVWRYRPEDEVEAGAKPMYIVSTPRFETGDDRYRWLQDYVYVAQGDVTMLDGGEYLAEVSWRIFTVLDD